MLSFLHFSFTLVLSLSVGYCDCNNALNFTGAIFKHTLHAQFKTKIEIRLLFFFLFDKINHNGYFYFYRSISEGGKRSVFLTNTQALARQQAEVIGKMTSLNVRVYTGDMDVDAWNREKWSNEFESAQV